jgi:hypothetical protein
MDPYKILGVPKGASPDLIREAYRNKSKKYHPDAGGDDWAFIQVEEAYRYLITHLEGTGARLVASDQGPSSRGSRTDQPWRPGGNDGSRMGSREERNGTRRTERANDDHPLPRAAHLFARVVVGGFIGGILGLIAASFLGLSYTICGVMGVIGGSIGSGASSEKKIERQCDNQQRGTP